MIIPLTHQNMPEDRRMAEAIAEDGQVPLIIGAHDHEPYHESVEGCQIIKTGCDAQAIAVIDIVWQSLEQEEVPKVYIEMVKVDAFAADKSMLEAPHDPPEARNPHLVLVMKAMERHKEPIRALQQSILADCGRFGRLDSTQIRLRPTSMGTAITTLLREALSVDCVLMNAGGIRGNCLYEKDKKELTYADLKKELPFGTELGVCQMPGKVIAEAVRYSRQFARLNPPVELAVFIQCDDRHGTIV